MAHPTAIGQNDILHKIIDTGWQKMYFLNTVLSLAGQGRVAIHISGSGVILQSKAPRAPHAALRHDFPHRQTMLSGHTLQ